MYGSSQQRQCDRQLRRRHGRLDFPAHFSTQFFSDGLLGPFCGQTGWCLRDYFEEDWMVTDFKIHRGADSPADSNQKIRQRDRLIAACMADEEKARLICINLEAWPKKIGAWMTADQENVRSGVKKFFAKACTGHQPYQLRIWFVAPEDMEGFEKHCLSFFTRYFEQRNVHHDDLYDVDGISFTDHLNLQNESSPD